MPVLGRRITRLLLALVCLDAASPAATQSTVRRRLAENELKPWRKDMWCIPQIDGNYVARMEDVLDLYAEEPDPKRPVGGMNNDRDSPRTEGFQRFRRLDRPGKRRMTVALNGGLRQFAASRGTRTDDALRSAIFSVGAPIR